MHWIQIGNGLFAADTHGGRFVVWHHHSSPLGSAGTGPLQCGTGTGDTGLCADHMIPGLLHQCCCYMHRADIGPWPAKGCHSNQEHTHRSEGLHATRVSFVMG